MSDSVTRWLQELGFGQYATAFAEEQIDDEVLLELTDADLKELGIPLGPRKKLLKAIDALRAEAAATKRPSTDDNRLVPDAERRQLTVMFCDLVGSTELSQILDPEDLRDVNRAYQDACKRAIEEYEGYVARYMGDGVLAYFGYPRAHEDDAERAIHAGLGLVQAMSRLSTEIGNGRAGELTVRVGIATGPVVVGDLIGEGSSQESAVVGETPNLAARLQALAKPDTVVVSPATYELAGGHFEYEDLGQHELKGIVEPVKAWRVVGLSVVESRFEASHKTALTPLVGREHEIALLLDRWAQAKEGDGQVVLLSGEAGIGKSRITHTLRERSAIDEPIRLRYQCSPYHTNSALYPIIEHLERAARFEEGDSPATKLDKLESLLGGPKQEALNITVLVAALLAIPSQGRYAPLEMPPDRQKERTIEALVARIEELSRNRPVLFIFEDAHWADPTSIELLGLSLERAQSLPLLMLITFRPDFSFPWTGYTHITSLALNRFSRNLVTAMLEKLTGGKPLPEEVRNEIVEKTDGVPLFVEELTKTILESKLVEETPERYVLSGAMANLSVPTTLHDSLMARLDRLGSVKEVAQCAAAIGREFEHDLLAAVSTLSTPELQDAITELVDAELVFVRGHLPRMSYIFKHALVQDAAYDSLLRSRRQQLHARIAEALEQRFPERVESEPELLAHHYTEAGLGEPAVEYWLRAGRQAMERSANQEAVVHLTKGLEILEALSASTERDRKELDIQIALARSLNAIQGWGSNKSMDAYARARVLCERVGETEQLLTVLIGDRIKHWRDADYRAAVDVSHQIARLAEKQNDPFEVAFAHMCAVWPYLGLGEFEPIRPAVDNVLRLYDPNKHKVFHFRYGLDLRTTALSMRGYQQWLCGFPDQAVESMARALAWARELDHAGTFVWSLNWAGSQLAAMMHDAQTAEALTEELMSLPENERSPQDLAWGQVFAGWAIAQRGTQEGVSLLREGINYLIAEGVKMWQSLHLALLAELYIDSGEFEKASQALNDAMLHIEQHEERLWEAEIHRLLGEVLLAQESDDAEQAERHFRQAIDESRRQGSKSLELRSTISLARLWKDQGKFEEAHELLDPAYNWFTEGFGTMDLKDAKSLLVTLS